jgi:toxin CcdB
MAQYDVYLNPVVGARSVVPYVVNLQSDLISQLPSRLVAPLSRVGLNHKLPTNLSPSFVIEGESLLFMPHESAPLGERSLGKPVTSLVAFSSQILSALDAVTSGF